MNNFGDIYLFEDGGIGEFSLPRRESRQISGAIVGQHNVGHPTTVVGNGVPPRDVGDVQVTAGLESAVYLSLFSSPIGHDEDWWGDSDGIFGVTARSDTSAYMSGRPLSAAATNGLIAVIRRDLAWLGGRVSGVSVDISGTNRVNIAINIDGGTLEFFRTWASFNQSI